MELMWPFLPRIFQNIIQEGSPHPLACLTPLAIAVKPPHPIQGANPCMKGAANCFTVPPSDWPVAIWGQNKQTKDFPVRQTMSAHYNCYSTFFCDSLPPYIIGYTCYGHNIMIVQKKCRPISRSQKSVLLYGKES